MGTAFGMKKPGISAWLKSPFAGASVILFKNQIVKIGIGIIAEIHGYTPFKNTPGQYIPQDGKNVPEFLDRL